MDAASRSTALPPELLRDEHGSFARSVMRERNPALIEQLRHLHPYDADQHAALTALVDEMTSTGPPLDTAEPDHAVWQQWGANYFGRPWSTVPFLWAENFYRRILQAVEYFRPGPARPGPWMLADPFEPFKQMEQRSPAFTNGLRALDTSGRFIASNADRELAADLVLIDHLPQAGLASDVALHVKPHPYYVSDAVTADVLATLNRLAAEPGEAATIGHRLHDALTGGRLIAVPGSAHAGLGAVLAQHALCA